MDRGQFGQATKVVIEPLVGVSMTILPFIGDSIGINLITQLCDMTECVSLVSMMTIKGISFMKHETQIKSSDLETSTPLRAKNFPFPEHYDIHLVISWVSVNIC